MSQEAKHFKGDIICIQETLFSSSNPFKCTHKLSPNIFTANTAVKKHGTLIAIKNTHHSPFLNSRSNGRCPILVCDINNITYTIVNVYAPNSHQIAFLHKLLKKICQVPKGSLLICGDFNVIVDNNLDSTAKSHTRPTLQHVLHKKDLYDVWCCLKGSVKNYYYFFK